MKPYLLFLTSSAGHSWLPTSGLSRGVLTLGIVLVLAAGSLPAAKGSLITWDGGAADDLWSSGANWSGTPDNTSPVDGDSVVLTNRVSRLNYAWTIESGQSLTSATSGFGDELVLEGGGTGFGAGTLTLSTGGAMDIGFMRPRYSSGGQFLIEAGASLATDNYGLGAVSATITFEANAAGVTLWDSSAGQFQMGSDNLIVDLTNYDFANGNTLTLVNYGDTGGQTFGSVNVLGANFVSIDYGDGTNDSIMLTASAIPEPSTFGLLLAGLSYLTLSVRRRRFLRP